MNDEMAALIRNIKPRYVENPYWGMNNGKIWDKRAKQEFNFDTLIQILPFLLGYFRLNYDSFQTESQVLVLEDEDYQKLSNKNIPELDISPIDLGIHILVLPQVNTWANTSVSESFWQSQIASKHIFPLMRIHTHHVLNAYQSTTDWSSLNSGSLEVVVGKIYDDVPEIAFWLDIRGTENKNTVFKSVDCGHTIQTIPSGKPHLESDEDTILKNLMSAMDKRNTK